MGRSSYITWDDDGYWDFHSSIGLDKRSRITKENIKKVFLSLWGSVQSIQKIWIKEEFFGTISFLAFTYYDVEKIKDIIGVQNIKLALRFGKELLEDEEYIEAWPRRKERRKCIEKEIQQIESLIRSLDPSKKFRRENYKSLDDYF